MQTYKEQIEQAIRFIESHLTERLDAERVAASVHLSYYHFHRIFAAMTGETLGDYIRKRRLTEAAVVILSSERSILDIALEFQFDSQEAFSRSFKQVFSTTPGSFRKRSRRPIFLEKDTLLGDRLQHRLDSISLVPSITEIKNEIHVVGISGAASPDHNTIPELWEELLQRRHEIQGMTPELTGYGICPPQHEVELRDITEHSPFGHIAGFSVERIADIPHGMRAYTVSAGTYAVFKHQGITQQLRSTYDYIWGTWLSNTPLRLDDRADFEVYGRDFYGPHHPQSTIWIYIPIQK
ncbi:AraC family transcriptional regulator [Paenibacillus sp. E194]|uniref:AraC family transcriptional regulator n=1 Tax=Paenibacillus sp. E194 TaxID=1458845 RepID=UPI0005CA7CD3|nr:AraC family transcriptional regulator [Paenibacillus sp. E194]KJB89452.1 AraC family transcriptional regulator [Paenibacillus sp. E194]